MESVSFVNVTTDRPKADAIGRFEIIGHRSRYSRNRNMYLTNIKYDIPKMN